MVRIEAPQQDRLQHAQHPCGQMGTSTRGQNHKSSCGPRQGCAARVPRHCYPWPLLGAPQTSNNSPPPLIVTMTALGGLSPRSKRMGISQMYIKLWHELLRATLLALTLYNIYIYRHASP